MNARINVFYPRDLHYSNSMINTFCVCSKAFSRSCVCKKSCIKCTRILGFCGSKSSALLSHFIAFYRRGNKLNKINTKEIRQSSELLAALNRNTRFRCSSSPPHYVDAVRRAYEVTYYKKTTDNHSLKVYF